MVKNICFGFAFLAVSARIACADAIGFKEITLPDLIDGRPLHVGLWYPTRDNGAMSATGETPAFMAMLVMQAASGKNIGRIMSVVSLPAVLGPILGPVLGGLILQHLHWSWMFWINLPFCIAGLVLAAIVLPADSAGGRQTFTKLTQRGAWDFATVSLAGARRADGSVRLALGGVAPAPWRINPSVEEDVASGELDEDSADALALRALHDAKPLAHNAYKLQQAASLLRKNWPQPPVPRWRALPVGSRAKPPSCPRPQRSMPPRPPRSIPRRGRCSPGGWAHFAPNHSSRAARSSGLER